MTIIDRTSPNCPGWKSYPDGTEDDKLHYTENSALQRRVPRCAG
jgi:hypothetical protein